MAAWAGKGKVDDEGIQPHLAQADWPFCGAVWRLGLTYVGSNWQVLLSPHAAFRVTIHNTLGFLKDRHSCS